MKKTVLSFFVIGFIAVMASCGISKLGYILNERDAAAAIRELLQLGSRSGVGSDAFSRQNVLSAIFPENVQKTLNTIQQFGLSGEVDRFVNTLGTAAEKTAQRSIPVFESGISRMSLTDAISIVKGKNTAATDYLRMTIGDSLRRAVKPVMQQALDEYQLTQKWNQIIKPAQSLLGNKINLDLPNLMAGLVTEAMFRKIAEKEIQVRSDISARTTPLLQKVFAQAGN